MFNQQQTKQSTMASSSLYSSEITRKKTPRFSPGSWMLSTQRQSRGPPIDIQCASHSAAPVRSTGAVEA